MPNFPASVGDGWGGVLGNCWGGAQIKGGLNQQELKKEKSGPGTSRAGRNSNAP